MRKTFLFLDTIANKVDAKGRVSLPAITAQSLKNSQQKSFVTEV